MSEKTIRWMARQCLSKARYKTIPRANKAIKEVRKKYKIKMYSYYCNICGYYHLTKKEKDYE